MDDPGMLNLGSNTKHWDYLLESNHKHWDYLFEGNPKHWDYMLVGNPNIGITVWWVSQMFDLHSWWSIPRLGTSENIRIAPIVPFQSIIILPNMFSPPRKDIGQNVRETLDSDQYLQSPKL